MWVRLIPGFDEDGLVIPKWRDAFIQRGAQEGELTIGDEEVTGLRRRALVARLTVSGKEVYPPLVDVIVRYTKNRTMTLSGISEKEPWNRWHAQAWRMEVIALTPPASAPDQPEQQATVKEKEGAQ